MPIKHKIKAKDAVRDIRSGMTDSQLMEKYGLSVKGLQSLLLKLLEVRAITPAEIDQRRVNNQDTMVIERIKEEEFAESVRSGMPDRDLMKKYGLSSDGLRRIFHKLVDADSITVTSFYRPPLKAQDTVVVEDMRELARAYLAVPLDVFESERPEIRGLLINITEKGIATIGMSAAVGETKTLVIAARDFIGSDPIVFEAECRWVKEEEETREWFAGFEIERISERCLDNLRRLIQSLPFLE